MKDKDIILPTGVPGFDKSLGGGLREGLHVVTGPANSGKTTFLKNGPLKEAQKARLNTIFFCEDRGTPLLAVLQDKGGTVVPILRSGSGIKDIQAEIEIFEKAWKQKIDVVIADNFHFGGDYLNTASETDALHGFAMQRGIPVIIAVNKSRRTPTNLSGLPFPIGCTAQNVIQPLKLIGEHHTVLRVYKSRTGSTGLFE
ncbi:nucleoside triphosphate hydrolase domain-containing protein [Myxococcus phage Mx1]|nr:nucleoside triphosphate hydrolase domain-containing protein [Myxococcus phage Mx1]